RRSDAGDHLLGVDELLARAVPAALGRDLVLDLHRGDAGALELANGARDRVLVAPAGVDVDDQRQLGRSSDARGIGEDVGKLDDPEVGEAERMVGYAGARQVERAEAGPLRELRRVRV